MTATLDLEYLRLYREYAKAIKAYHIALEKRKRIRDMLRKRRLDKSAIEANPALKYLDQWRRRPIGSPARNRVPTCQETKKTVLQSTAQKQKIYLGPILGWSEVVLTSPKIQILEDSEKMLDMDAHYDRVSLNLYWKTKTHYEKCKRAFFEYVRKSAIEKHKKQAVRALKDSANKQLLGTDSDESWAEAKREVEAALRHAWAIYKTSPSPKSKEMKIFLMDSLVDAKFVGLVNESQTAQSMQQEVNRLQNTGEMWIKGGWDQADKIAKR